jgi:hypothetical protein
VTFAHEPLYPDVANSQSAAKALFQTPNIVVHILEFVISTYHFIYSPQEIVDLIFNSSGNSFSMCKCAKFQLNGDFSDLCPEMKWVVRLILCAFRKGVK